MKICIFGQGTGGNASLWFDYFNKSKLGRDVIFVSRTISTLKSNFKLISPFGHGGIPNFIYKFYAPFISRFVLKIIFTLIKKVYCPRVVLLQGNYTPRTNLMVINTLKCKSVLNIYGSDFYRKYLLKEFSEVDRHLFEEVVRKVDVITFNWDAAFSDFIAVFPSVENKCKIIPWGVSNFWYEDTPEKQREKKVEEGKIFLSTRAIYDYNNIDVVVEAFCRTLVKFPDSKLYIVNGYGNHKDAVAKVLDIIDRYNASGNIFLMIDEWISSEKLRYLYNIADFNVCFGSSDQLTLSITYSFLNKTINILSPLDSYNFLKEYGFDSHVIAEDFSLESLENLYSYLIEFSDDRRVSLDRDFLIAKDLFDIEKTISMYVNIFDPE